MQTFRHNSWKSFCDRLEGHATLSQHERDQWWFRGHADTQWSLETALDRYFNFADDADRDQCYTDLLDEFAQELRFVGDRVLINTRGDALELMARHQGLPTPHLDWSRSPYVATYFALEGAVAQNSNYAAIWAFHRAAMPITDSIDLIDDPALIQFNRRALHQRGVFMRVGTCSQTVEQLLDAALVKFEIRTTEAPALLVHLEDMTINSTYLFSDAESAARTAAIRVSLRR